MHMSQPSYMQLRKGQNFKTILNYINYKFMSYMTPCLLSSIWNKFHSVESLCLSNILTIEADECLPSMS